MEIERKNHWETVYETKQPNEVSWTQENPKTSLDFIRETHLDKTAKIIDIGGGDSNLVDFLLEEGYENISVLDISANALERAKKRLGKNAEKVTWIVSDITEFKPETKYDIWHDRATFHFLTTEEQIKKYTEITQKWINGYLIIGTFSENGPKKCSGLDIKQYSETAMENQFSNSFKKLKCITEDHTTPFETKQNFTFCLFEKRN
ncbi:MAG TPA: class I SAM-dependent methyltransferase [Flavobacterium sp.]|nr:class I SAM-dependent methyltransferase [Flavobacterium sp.]